MARTTFLPRQWTIANLMWLVASAAVTMAAVLFVKHDLAGAVPAAPAPRPEPVRLPPTNLRLLFDTNPPYRGCQR
jgi:hypothetical protein